MRKKSFLINNFSILGGAICIIFAFIAQKISDPPIDMLHKIQNRNIIPPMWLFNILFIFWFFLLGVSAGAEFFITQQRLNTYQREISAYQGGLFFICTLFLSSVWYPLFFSGDCLFLSVIVSALSLICIIICTAFWLKTYVLTPAIITLGFSVWSFYILFVSISVFIVN